MDQCTILMITNPSNQFIHLFSIQWWVTVQCSALWDIKIVMMFQSNCYLPQLTFLILQNQYNCTKIINLINKKLSMKKIPYSPFNKTYQYICMQNQAAHRSNLSKCVGMTQSNIAPNNMSLYNSRSLIRTGFKSNATYQPSSLKNPYRIIHRDKSANMKKWEYIQKQNQILTQKLNTVQCRVIQTRQSLRQYSEHCRHLQLSRRYANNGKRKDLVKLNNFSAIATSRLEKSLRSFTGQKDKPLRGSVYTVDYLNK